jgi:pentatricopeptide repeat protein
MSLWVMAEMLYHRSRNEPQLVLVIFAYHFHMIGVPRRTILKIMRLMSKRRASLSQRMSLPKHMLNTQYDISEKLWPTPYHTALVWEALVWMTPERDHERLYKYLLATAESSTSQKPIPPPNSKFAPSLVQLPKRAVDAAHFSPFVKLHAKRGRPERAAGVLSDMMKLGLNPGVVQWSIVARGFAEHGDPAVVFVILKQLEGVIGSQDRGASDDASGAAAEPADQAQTSNFPDIGFYTNVLRGFVLARKLEHAQDMEKRFRQRFDYVDGDLKATDDALRLLRNLERQMV